MAPSDHLLNVQELIVHFPVRGATRRGEVVHAVNGVDLVMRRGESLGLVGESGCGKSTLGRAVAQLLPVTRGRVVYDNHDLTAMWSTGWLGRRFAPRPVQLRQRIQMIFQDPYSSLDPRMTVLQLVAEPLVNFGAARGKQLEERVIKVLSHVGMSRAALHRYPHEFSGGQKQRIGIARALAADPQLIVCDEPISALDVSIQAQVINLLQELRRELGLCYLFISHDLAAVRLMSDSIAVMYLGRIVEQGPAVELCAAPKHPYTQALLSALPDADPVRAREQKRLPLLGEVPSAINPPAGCHFHPRCMHAEERCTREVPPWRTVEGHSGWRSRCHLQTGPH